MNFIKSLLVAVILGGTVTMSVGFDDSPAINQDLQDISVLVHGLGNARGSGTIVMKAGGNQYVITAYHVVHSLRKPDLSFDPITITQTHEQDGVEVARTEYKTELVRYSAQSDIAVLHVIKKYAFGKTARFSRDNVPEKTGTRIRHVGCFNGNIGYNSYSEGVVSHQGRTSVGGLHMQISAPHYPGSSGGGVYTMNGRYIGMLLMRHDSTLGLANPIQEIRRWADRAGVGWLFINGDYSPTLTELRKRPLNVE